MARVWRLYQRDLPDAPGSEVELAESEAHHACTVLRLREGERVEVFDGREAEWSATVIRARNGRVVLRLVEECRGGVEPSLRVSIYQGLCRAERMEWVIQKATEIGAAAVHPLRTERGEMRAVSPRRLERWGRIAVEACKQSGRRVVPVIETRDELPASGAAGETGILLHPGHGSRGLGSLIAGSPPASVAIAVGPEGGFTDDEVRQGLERGWEAFSLGPRILRTETAGVVALSLLMHRWGDLG